MSKRGPWWVVAKEERNGEKRFCIYEPVYDDTPHTEKSAELLDQGQQVNICTAEADQSRENIIHTFTEYGYTYTEDDLLWGGMS